MAKQEKAFAVFDATIKAALAIVEAIINPSKIPQAITSGLQAEVITTTPLPEFEQGSFRGSDAVGVYIGKGIVGVTHPNEFVINAQQLINPIIYNMANNLDSDNTGQSLGAN